MYKRNPIFHAIFATTCFIRKTKFLMEGYVLFVIILFATTVLMLKPENQLNLSKIFTFVWYVKINVTAKNVQKKSRKLAQNQPKDTQCLEIH